MRRALVREAKVALLKLKIELGKAKYELITCADRRKYDEFAAKFNSFADDSRYLRPMLIVILTIRL